MQLTNFCVAAMAAAINRDISLLRQDNELLTPPTLWVTLISTETVKNAARCKRFDEVMPFLGLPLPIFASYFEKSFFITPDFTLEILPHLTPAHLPTLPQSTV